MDMVKRADPSPRHAEAVRRYGEHPICLAIVLTHWQAVRCQCK